MGTGRLTVLFVAVLLVGCVVGVLVPAGLGWDFANFYDAGRRVVAGQSEDLYKPSTPIAGQPPQGKTGFYGTPISAVLYIPLAGLSARAALVWFKIQNVVAFFVAFVLLYRFYRPFTPPDPAARQAFTALFAGLCLVFQPFWTVFRVGGQTTPFAFALVTLALIFHTNARFWSSATSLVLAALIKPALAPLLLFLVCVSGTSFLLASTVVLLVTGSLSLIVFGWPVHAAFLTLMRESGQSTWAWYYNSSIFILLDNIRSWMGPAALSGAYRPVFLGLTYHEIQLGVLVAIARLTINAHRETWTGPARRHFDVLMGIMVFLLWSRTVWEHYLALLFIPLVYVIAVKSRFSRAALGLIAAIFVLSVFQNLIVINWLRASFAFTSLPAAVGIALFKSGPLLLMAVFLSRHWRELFDSFAAWPATPAASSTASGLSR